MRDDEILLKMTHSLHLKLRVRVYIIKLAIFKKLFSLLENVKNS